MDDQPAPESTPTENPSPESQAHWFYNPRTFWIIFLLEPALGILSGVLSNIDAQLPVNWLWIILLVPCSLACGYWIAARKFTESSDRLVFTVIFSVFIGPSIVVLSFLGCSIVPYSPIPLIA